MIYFCIPAHNEERTVGVLLWKIRQVMSEFPRDYQLLVVDDASTDATPAILDPYTRVLPLTVFSHAECRGYAASLEELVREAVRRSPYPRRDVVVTLQADFTDEPDEIPTLLKRVEGGADTVTGSTRLGGDGVPRGVRWARRALGLLLRRVGWREPVTDPVSGFRAYRVNCLKRALDARNGERLLELEGWAANAELLRAVQPFCRRLDETEVPVRYDRRERATRFRLWRTARQLLRLARSAPAGNGDGVRDDAVPSDSGGPTAAGPGARAGRRRAKAAGGGEAGESAADERGGVATAGARPGGRGPRDQGNRSSRGGKGARGGRGRRGSRSGQRRRRGEEGGPRDSRSTDAPPDAPRKDSGA